MNTIYIYRERQRCDLMPKKNKEPYMNINSKYGVVMQFLRH